MIVLNHISYSSARFEFIDLKIEKSKIKIRYHRTRKNEKYAFQESLSTIFKRLETKTRETGISDGN